MDWLQEYIVNIIYVAVFAFIVEIVVPKHSFKKYISGILSFLVVISIVSPVIDFLKNDKISDSIQTAIEAISFTNYSYSQDAFNIEEYQNKIILSSVKEKLEKELSDKFKSRISGVKSVEVILDSSYRLDKIFVYISKNNLGEEKVKYILDTLLEEYELPKEILVIKKEQETYE